MCVWLGRSGVGLEEGPVMCANQGLLEGSRNCGRTSVVSLSPPIGVRVRPTKDLQPSVSHHVVMTWESHRNGINVFGKGQEAFSSISPC